MRKLASCFAAPIVFGLAGPALGQAWSCSPKPPVETTAHLRLWVYPAGEECEWSSCASAVGMAILMFPGCSECTDAGGAGSAQCRDGPSTAAGGYTATCFHEDPSIWTSAYVDVEGPSNFLPAIAIDVTNGISSGHCGGPCEGGSSGSAYALTVGASTGSGLLVVDRNCVENAVYTISAFGGLVPDLGGKRRFGGYVLRHGPSPYTDYPFTLQESQHGRASAGLTMDAMTGSANPTLHSGSNEFRVVGSQGNDSAYDVNGDGRFNASDVAALTGLITSTNATDLRNWDYDYSGVIDAADVEVLQVLIDSGLSAGILGDFNQDGTANACDLSGIDSYFGYDMGDPDYRIELDANLDGRTDSTDREAVYFKLCMADANQDGGINVADFSAFLSLYSSGSWRADANHDGNINVADFSAFLAAYSAGCPCP